MHVLLVKQVVYMRYIPFLLQQNYLKNVFKIVFQTNTAIWCTRAASGRVQLFDCLVGWFLCLFFVSFCLFSCCLAVCSFCLSFVLSVCMSFVLSLFPSVCLSFVCSYHLDLCFYPFYPLLVILNTNLYYPKTISCIMPVPLNLIPFQSNYLLFSCFDWFWSFVVAFCVF